MPLQVKVMEPSFIEAVRTASKRHDVIDAVHALYARVTAEIDVRRPKCEMSGRCCNFETYGHRLYLTTVELAAFLHDLPATQLPQTIPQAGCPFQLGKLCTVHPIRPFGCRIFFCDPTATEWQQSAYERFHAELKQLHEALDVPYAYMEWRTVLGGIMGEPISPSSSAPSQDSSAKNLRLP
jgi:Fe-S-cluster containining protein